MQYPPDNRIEPGSSPVPAAPFPQTIRSKSVDANAVADSITTAFNDALAAKDPDALVALFLPDDGGFWRDHLCLTWDMRTLRGRAQISGFLREGGDVRLPRKITVDRSSAWCAPKVTPWDGLGEYECVQFYVAVDAEAGRARGVIRLAEVDDGRFLIATIFTSLVEIAGHPEPLGHRRPKGVEHKAEHDGPNWRERREATARFEGSDPAVLIVGAGQAGLAVAARLQMQGVSTLLIDRNARVGDSWRKRYHQLVLHDPVWYDHMPYVPFPPHWPVFAPKDKIADFFEAYVSLLELNVWTGTNLTASSWDETTRQWTVTLEKTAPHGTKSTRTLHPRHVIQATGHSGKKNMPSIPGMSTFSGARLCHSADFPGANPGPAGRKAVVVGSCNSGHDIAQDLHSKGYSVTMVQRSSTCVISSDSTLDPGLRGLYDEDGPAVEDADLWLHAYPAALFKTQQRGVTSRQNRQDAETLAGLERAGFKIDMGPESCGLLIKYFQRGGGYYMDVGASRLIVDGKIKIKQGCEIVEVVSDGLKFADGEVLPADEIVFATGYLNMRGEARAIFGDALADRVGDVWGYDEKGEHKTIWGRSGHPGFWFMGGNLALCRYFSRVLALQIKAAELGLNKL